MRQNSKYKKMRTKNGKMKKDQRANSRFRKPQYKPEVKDAATD